MPLVTRLDLELDWSDASVQPDVPALRRPGSAAWGRTRLSTSWVQGLWWCIRDAARALTNFAVMVIASGQRRTMFQPLIPDAGLVMYRIDSKYHQRGAFKV